ncbi:MAG: PEP/pyruvate-binding domain-containing protein, partial [Dehalococcoidales bacterium]
HRRGLTEGDEQMAVLVQRVSGTPYKKYFFPSLAGVAFSRNLYAWTNRIDPSKGMIRLVFGLGTRAVNRVGGDYIRMIAVSHPSLRPEIGNEIAKYSQRLVDLLNLEENALQTQPFADVIRGNNYPVLNLLVSEMTEGYLRDWSLTPAEGAEDNFILTFNNLITRTALVSIIGEILAKLEKAWGQPVDIEFTAYVDDDNNVKVNLLQCRTLRVPTLTDVQASLPEKLSKEQILFRSNRAINAGVVTDIGYIIYIDPRKYAATSLERKRNLGRIVGQLNSHLRDKKCQVMMMGPGRWGSNNIELGINVGYADIDGTAILAEVAFEKAGHTPEVSYGTHFFQDLVESNILYLPVYPDDAATDFNTDFFARSPNVFKDLLPDFKDYADIVQVIDVPRHYDGAMAKVIADLETRHAICFLERSSTTHKKIKKEGKEK